MRVGKDASLQFVDPQNKGVLMVVQDLWMKKGPKGKKVPSKRYGRGQRWRVAVEDPDTGKTITEACDTEGAAKDRDAILRASVLKGTYVDPKKAKKTVEEHGEEWLGQLVMRESSRQAITSRFRNHVVPVLGKMPIGAVRSGSVQGWVRSRQQLKKPLAASTIRSIYNSVLFPMFARADMDDVIRKNPCVDITLPELPEGTYDLPTPEQVLDFSAKLPDRYKAVPLLAAGCGWRYSEIFGLEEGAVEFLAREAHVVAQLAEFRGAGVGLAPPKSKLSRRTTEVPEFTGNALSRHLELHPVRDVPVLDRTDPDEEVRRTARLFFTDDKGRPMRSARWWEVWTAATDELGMPRGLFTLHSMRHFFATTLIFNGAKVKAVQLACGHSSSSITLDTYLGYWPGDDRLGTRKLLDQAFADPVRTGSVPVVTG